MIDRRCHLFGPVRVAAAATIAILFAIFLRSAEGGHLRGFVYTIEQGGVVLGVIPLLGGKDVGTFYGYPGGANRSNTGLEQPDTSLLFLYEDPQGRVSLVMIHDAPNSGSGGRAILGFAGIPNGTGFLVRDDPGDSPYLITQPGGTATVAWEWNGINTDGGALNGSLEQQAWTITIAAQFPGGGGTTGSITAWRFLTGSLNSPSAIGLDPTKPITINAIPAALQVVTTARLTTTGQNCQVVTSGGPLTANLNVIVEGMLQFGGQQIIAPNGQGGLRITFEGEIPANSALTFTVSVDGGTPQVVSGVPVRGQFFAEATVTPPNVTFTTGPTIELSGDGFAFSIGGTTVFTGPWTLIAQDATLLNVMISPDFPQIGWTGRIEAEATPTLTFANVSACQFIGTGLRTTLVRSGFVDIKPDSFPNPINPTSKGVVPVAILGSDTFDVRTIDTATIEIDDDRVPGGGVLPTHAQTSVEDVNGDGFMDLSLKFDTPALNQAGLLGNTRLFITGAIGNGAPQVLGSDTICFPGQCVP